MPNTTPPQSTDIRSAVRFDTNIPVTIDGATGTTHNISAQGVYFETDVEQRLGSLVNFSVEFTLHGQKHKLLCEGKVVRVETQGDRVGVAARLLAPLFDTEEEVAAGR